MHLPDDVRFSPRGMLASPRELHWRSSVGDFPTLLLQCNSRVDRARDGKPDHLITKHWICILWYTGQMYHYCKAHYLVHKQHLYNFPSTNNGMHVQVDVPLLEFYIAKIVA